MTIRILLFSLLPLLSFAQSNSKVTIQNNKQTSEKGPLEPKRNTIFNLDEIKVRWKKAALENCPMVVCPTSSVPGPCTAILATPTGPSSASVSFVPPTNDGGSPITGYVVTATPTSSAPAKRKSSSVIIVTGTSSPILLTGLSFGINYIFSVLATNAVGGSPPITTTTTVTPCILNTAAASTNQTLVVNSALTNIMIATMGATGISNAGVSGSNSLPAGVSATFANNTITISGTPTASGTFSYSIPLTGGCGSVDATGTITVNAASLATLTTTAVSVVTDIGASSGGNITADGGAAITAKGVVWSTSILPTVSLSTKTTDGTGTGSFTSTISGLTASTKYYVRSYATNTSGTSYGSELDFTTCTLNTAAASTNQTLVVNSALTNIMIATMGATGISNAGVSGSNSLPAGVSATWAGNTITISGTPTATGTFSYNIPLTGGCGSVNATGTITVNAASLATLTTTAVSVVTDIGASSGGNITSDGGAAITAKGVVWSTSTLPTVSLSTKTTDGTGTGIFTSTISGLTASTKYYVRSYATNTSGTSYGSELDFTTCTLNTAAASTNQTLVVNTALTNIMIATMGATGISNAGVSGSNSLPAGVSANWAGNTITISGTPTATGTFIYSIPLTGGCGSVNATGTITVCSVLNTAGTPLTSPTLVVNSALTPITISTTGATGIGTATGLPAGVIASWMSDVITIRDTPTVSGTFNYTIPLTGGCGTVNATGTMTVIPACPIGKDTILDIDNNSYNIVGIGTQCWTKQNLRVRKYNDGTSILFDKTSGTDWLSLNYGAHSIYNHDSTPITGNLAIYGYLYNWYAAKGIASPNSVNYKNICPTGWHIPTDSDWNKLVKFLDSAADTTVNSSIQSSTVGGMLKSTLRWDAPNTGATSTNVFAALPGGFRGNNADFLEINQTTFFWSTTENVGSNANPRNRYLEYNMGSVRRATDQKSRGGSLRCLKD